MAVRSAILMQRWELHLRAQKRSRRGQQSEGSQAPMLGLNALKAWSRIPRTTRDALKRCSAEAVESLEMPILEFLDQVRASTSASLSSVNSLRWHQLGFPLPKEQGKMFGLRQQWCRSTMKMTSWSSNSRTVTRDYSRTDWRSSTTCSHAHLAKDCSACENLARHPTTKGVVARRLLLART